MLKTVQQAECPFAIKSGGHSRGVGASNADGGVTIDLVRLNGIQVSKNKKSVVIGAGLRWLDVYQELEKHNLLVVGGRVADVGVGGLLLGGMISYLAFDHADIHKGGISFFSNRHGWGCDNILSYEIVLPDGSIQTITQKSRPSLFKALRGAGSGNFGIVTSFELVTFPHVPEIWGGSKFYPLELKGALQDMSYEFTTKTLAQDPDAALISSYGYSKEYQMWFAVQLFRHTSHASNTTFPAAFESWNVLEGLPNMTAVSLKPLSQHTLEIAQSTPPGLRQLYGTFTYRPSAALDNDLLDIFRAEADKISAEIQNHFLPAVIYQALSPTMLGHMNRRGGNALDIASEADKGPLIIFLVNWIWSDPTQDDLATESYYRTMKLLEDKARESGLWHPFKYVNYAEEFQDVWEGLSDPAQKELKALQREVDPKGLFTKGGLGGGYFKLNSFGEGADATGKGGEYKGGKDEL